MSSRVGSGAASGADTDRSPVSDADVCVVGAGPAGALVASRLAARGRRVVVLEAGPRFEFADRPQQMERSIGPVDDRGDIWGMGGDRDAYASTGDRFYPLNANRVKGVGGTTLHWQGMVYRLHEKDFEMDSRYGLADDWPIGYDDLRLYYAEAEQELGVSGADDNPFGPPREEPYPLPAFPPSHSDSIFAEACEDLEIATHSAPNARNSEPADGRNACVGYGTCQPVCPSGAKYDATVHVERAEEAGARVIDRAPVQRLAHDASGERLEAAVYATPDGVERRQEADAFVLAAGGVEIPRLLLLSESTKHPDGLANRSGAVGRYFTEHLFAGAGGTIDRETRQNHVGFVTSESQQFYDHEEPTPGSVKLEFLNYAGPSPVEMALTGDAFGDELLADLREAYGNHLAVGALVEQLPRWENRITLDDSRTDDHGNPVPEIRWSVGDHARRTIERANEIQVAILEALDAEIEWVVGPEDTGPVAHHMGTTRMGTDPDESVVDPALRTHDLENCWIASSSVFVTGGALNPTLTIAALALKGAEHVDEWL
ncbi:GMC family oxidoreductase [Halomontanus rarus]|uniref:GMC family oxidoreductase n=1 Tax=Halomontanus rarus TaxID=3034020 RepID=UPI0023E7E879|nr:GMC family oxidoreductase [Halovivax sp. TS33]